MESEGYIVKAAYISDAGNESPVLSLHSTIEEATERINLLQTQITPGFNLVGVTQFRGNSLVKYT